MITDIREFDGYVLYADDGAQYMAFVGAESTIFSVVLEEENKMAPLSREDVKELGLSVVLTAHIDELNRKY